MVTKARSKKTVTKKKAPKKRVTKRPVAKDGSVALSEEQKQRLRTHDQKVAWLKIKLADATITAEQEGRQREQAEQDARSARRAIVDAVVGAQNELVGLARQIAEEHGIDLEKDPAWQLSLQHMELRRIAAN